jgi:ABC-type multidrug transport system fused ATPase/permease subunit
METPRLRQEVLASFLRPGVVGILRHMWRVAGVGPRDIAIPLALALLISAAEGASFAFLIPLSDGVAAGSFVFLDGSPRFGWVGTLVPLAVSPPDRDLALALILLALLLLGRFVKAALEFFRGWWLTWRDQRYFTAVGRETFRRVTSFGPLYFRRRPLAHIDAEISWAPTPIYVLGTLEALVMNVLRLAAKIVLVLAISPLLFLFLLVSLAALSALTHRVSRRARALADSAADVYKVTRRESLDALANMSMVKALRQEDTIEAGHGKRVDQAEETRAQIRRLGFLKGGLVETTVLLGALVGEGLILVFVPGPPALHLARFCAFFLVAQQCLPDLQEISANLFAFVKQAPVCSRTKPSTWCRPGDARIPACDPASQSRASASRMTRLFPSSTVYTLRCPPAG